MQAWYERRQAEIRSTMGRSQMLTKEPDRRTLRTTQAVRRPVRSSSRKSSVVQTPMSGPSFYDRQLEWQMRRRDACETQRARLKEAEEQQERQGRNASRPLNKGIIEMNRIVDRSSIELGRTRPVERSIGRINMDRIVRNLERVKHMLER